VLKGFGKSVRQDKMVGEQDVMQGSLVFWEDIVKKISCSLDICTAIVIMPSVRMRFEGFCIRSGELLKAWIVPVRLRIAPKLDEQDKERF
jgi:hypothetical protein